MINFTLVLVIPKIFQGIQFMHQNFIIIFSLQNLFQLKEKEVSNKKCSI